ncbi:class A beta-lactamase [Roseomonas xinghualingensis]|uniref:class A beta-lactamase n=1 Tax=Roseomonas xinghualingensis TaxID=2986475 RepID=UPI0021F24E98|nr:class A beta-lactamase [Roseomonas sp. SXEYE001]MCV4207621.1 class A beta-lactamase [Roseomonas sp. SXEYE001]
MIGKRQLGRVACAAMAGIAVRGAMAAEPRFASLSRELERLEAASGGRLGVMVIDTGTGSRAGYRANERFPMCSTFKVLAAAAVLARVDAGKERLDRLVPYGSGDLVVYSPVTKERTGAGMTLAELCAAAITLSDNTAGNLLLANIGGPAGFTAYMRSLGDEVTRLDRIEPALNEALPGDPRDTTSPAAMASSLQALALGTALSATSRAQLVQWLLDNKTGDTRLRARLPAGWRVGDKTGSGDQGTANDVGILWPPGGAPIIVSAYLTETRAGMDERSAILAAVGEAVAAG